MGVSEDDVLKADAYVPTLRGLSPDEDPGNVGAVAVRVEGRRGGDSGWWKWSPDAMQTYDVLLDVRNIASEVPPAWILSPPDSKIRHLNIFHFKYCDLLGRKLPRVCWGGFADRWAAAGPGERTLGAAISYLKQFLNDQNPSSPAR